MANVTLFDQTGKQAGEVVLNDAIFGIEPNQSVVFDVIISNVLAFVKELTQLKTAQLFQVADANHGVKKELDVLVKVLSALHNGVVVESSSDQLHVAMRTNFLKKVRRLALKSVYSEKVAENKFVAVDSLEFTAPKTAEFAKVLAALSIDSKVLVILEEGNEFAALSARNLPNVKVATATTASVLDIANSDKLLVTQAAISKIEEVLA